MLIRTPQIFNRSVSTSAALGWRTRNAQNQLVSQISSTLLQRHNWAPLLRSLNLSSRLTPLLCLRVLQRTRTNPQISLAFFNWARTNLGFQPDLKTFSKLIQILVGSGLSQPTKSILNSLIHAYPPTQIVDSLLHTCKGTDFHSPVLSSLVECYCNKGLCLPALGVFRISKDNGYVLSIRSCNKLLDALQEQNEIRLTWCFFGSMLRNEALANQSTLSIIARALCKSGKFERIVGILDMGIYNSAIYNMLIDCYSERGDFRAAFDYLTEMCCRKFNASFSTYSAILNGACKFGAIDVADMITGCMVKKRLLLKLSGQDYDLIIQKLADLGRTYAAGMFFERACDYKIELQAASYGCMLKAFSNGGRVKEAIGIYRMMLQSGVVVNETCYLAFVNVLCREDQVEEVGEFLRDMIKKDFCPCGSEISKFITSQCDKGRWKEAEELLHEILEKEFLPDSFCCHSLIAQYCSSKQIDSAIALHDKIEKLEGTLDVATYNILLNELFKEKRVDDSIRVFDYMRKQNVISSESFSIMISGLCREKELKKAMKIHDEMLRMGLKPDARAYKRLIRGFK